MLFNSEIVNEKKKKVLELFTENYLKNNDKNHILGMIFCGSFKNDDNNDFSDIDIQIIMDETFSEESNNNKNGGNIIRGVELINNYRFEYFVRNIQGYYFEAQEAYKQQKNALLTIIGYGEIFFYADDKSLLKIKDLQKFIKDLYSKPLPVTDKNDLMNQLFYIYEDINLFLELYKNDSCDFDMNYYLLLEKIRKFYSRGIGCCYLPPAKVWKIYNDKAYAERFCKSKIPDDEFILEFTDCILNNSNKLNKIHKLKKLVNLCSKKLNLNNLDNIATFDEEDNIENNILDKDEILELIFILENRRLKLNEKFVNKENDFDYFYFIVLQMIDKFSKKINNSFNVIDEQYQQLFCLAKNVTNLSEKNNVVNNLLDYLKEKCESLYNEKINPLQYRVLVKPTTWNNNKQCRF